MTYSIRGQMLIGQFNRSEWPTHGVGGLEANSGASPNGGGIGLAGRCRVEFEAAERVAGHILNLF